MTKLQFLKICALNLIFGATVVAGDLDREGLGAEEPKLVRKSDKRIRVYGSTIGLDEGAVPSGDRFVFAKHLRDSYTMGDEERENLQGILSAISENSIGADSLVEKLKDAVEKGHLGIVRHLAVYCPSEDVDIIAGGAFKAKKLKITKIIKRSNEVLGNKMPFTRVIFRERLGAKTEVKHKPDAS